MPIKSVAYHKQYGKRHYQQNKAAYKSRDRERARCVAKWFADFKIGLKCQSCTEDCPACLDFHHKDSAEKVDHIARMVCRKFGKEKILAEVRKCVVLCANCHRKVEAGIITCPEIDPCLVERQLNKVEIAPIVEAVDK